MKRIYLTEQQLNRIIINESSNDSLHKYIEFINTIGKEGKLPPSSTNFLEYVKSMPQKEFIDNVYSIYLQGWAEDRLFDELEEKGIPYESLTKEEEDDMMYKIFIEDFLFDCEKYGLRIDEDNCIHICRDIMIPKAPSARFVNALYNGYNGVGTCWSFADNQTAPYCPPCKQSDANDLCYGVRLYGRVRFEDINIENTISSICNNAEHEIRVNDDSPIELNKIRLIYLHDISGLQTVPSYQHDIWNGSLIVNSLDSSLNYIGFDMEK